jgi:hypothetical protein
MISLSNPSAPFWMSERILDPVLAAHALKVALPTLSIGWIAGHEVELAGGKGVVRERGVLRSADDFVRSVSLAFEQEVGLADRVSLGVDFLAEEVGGYLLAVHLRALVQSFLDHGEHTAGPEGTPAYAKASTGRLNHENFFCFRKLRYALCDFLIN